MNHLDQIADQIRADFDGVTDARDQALSQARMLTRHCAHAIRAVHREEWDVAQQELDAASDLATPLREMLTDYPNLYFAGYTQDALKEYAEAHLTMALIRNAEMPSHEELGLEGNTYLKGLAETIGELRRRILDILRHGHSDEAERLLAHMDAIYSVLVTMDYSNAVTGGLRRLTDISRGIIERTRGDITISFRQQRLEEVLSKAESELKE